MSFAMKVSDAVKFGQFAMTSVSTIQTSAYIDRTDFNSILVSLSVGDVFGAPSAMAANMQITHCATTNGSYTAYTSDRSGVALTTIAAANTNTTMEVDLGSALQFIKINTTTTFTAGSSPYTNRVLNYALGGSHYLPPV